MESKKAKHYEEFNNDGEDYKVLDQDERTSLAQKNNLLFHDNIERAANMALSLKVFKVMDYGEKKYDRKSTSAMLWLAYSDVWKKFLRLEKLTENACDVSRTDRVKALKKLRDDYMDLANFALDSVAMVDFACESNLGIDINDINFVISKDDLEDNYHEDE